MRRCDAQTVALQAPEARRLLEELADCMLSGSADRSLKRILALYVCLDTDTIQLVGKIIDVIIIHAFL